MSKLIDKARITYQASLENEVSQKKEQISEEQMKLIEKLTLLYDMDEITLRRGREINFGEFKDKMGGLHPTIIIENLHYTFDYILGKYGIIRECSEQVGRERHAHILLFSNLAELGKRIDEKVECDIYGDHRKDQID